MGQTAASAAPTNQRLVGLTAQNQLVAFRSYTPETIQSTVAITGLPAGEKIVGIDHRPATGELWALGRSGSLYVIDPVTGAADDRATLSTPLSGVAFGIDFNPVVDRLRIVSNTGQNLRVVPDTGAVTPDGELNYDDGTDPLVRAVGYTNSQCGVADPGRTTALYDIDHGEDVLAQQNPPNNGDLTVIGGLGVDVTPRVGFDVSPNNNGAYLSTIRVGSSVSRLSLVDLNTGDLNDLGPIGRPIIDLSVAFRGSCPAPTPV